ncbi:hypothetical protein [Aeromicrobium sp.]|uniref:hypothetical protein n=1 Tax=Aeromicrobium sp. TaxID=1871063 RepID=UPI0025B9BA94|nr:hypothetical protein [Aeromicrobium sp.]MCK5891287.1 hypothetical protein [Aeromicrobium sp.]
MPIMIPEPVEWALDLFGLKWININEDAVEELGGQLLAFTEGLDSFVEAVGNAIGTVAEVSDSSALDSYTDVFQDTRSQIFTPLNEAVGATQPICSAIADGIRSYKYAVLAVGTVQAGLMIAAGPAGALVRLAAKEAIRSVVEVAVAELMSQVVGAINQQIQEQVIDPINNLTESAIQAVTRPVSDVVVSLTPSVSGTVVVPTLVCDVLDIEKAVTDIQTAYDDFSVAFNTLLDWHMQCDYLTPTSIPDLATSGMFKAMLDDMLDTVSSEMGLMGQAVVEKLASGVTVVYEKYTEADEQLAQTGSEVLDNIEFPPLTHPFLIDREPAPAPTDIDLSDGPVQTGAGQSDASDGLATTQVDLADDPIQTGPGESTAREDIEQVQIDEPDAPVQTGPAQSDARDNIQPIHVNTGQPA